MSTPACRFARGALLGAVCAALSVLPGAARASGPDASFAWCWLALFGGSAALLMPLVGALRVAGRPPRRALAVPLGIGLALGPMVALGALLSARTHHRPLGGATFGVLAAGIMAAAIAFVARLLHLAESASGGSRRAARAAVLACALVATTVLVALLWSALGGAAAVVRPSVLDAALALGTTAAAWLLPLHPPVPRASAAALGVWIVAVALGLWAFGAAAVQQATTDRAPVLVGLLWLFA